MTAQGSLDKRTLAIAERMEQFEASESVARTGTGSRREGEGFERLVGELWESVRLHAVRSGAVCAYVAGPGRRRWARLSVGDRALYLPNAARKPVSNPDGDPSRWLEVVFPVSDEPLSDRLPRRALT